MAPAHGMAVSRMAPKANAQDRFAPDSESVVASRRGEGRSGAVVFAFFRCSRISFTVTHFSANLVAAQATNGPHSSAVSSRAAVHFARPCITWSVTERPSSNVTGDSAPSTTRDQSSNEPTFGVDDGGFWIPKRTMV
jgi:hypothetical protein